MHIEQIELDEALIQTAILNTEIFWRLCFIPELIGKWYTCIDQPSKEKALEVEIVEHGDTAKKKRVEK